MKKETDRDGWMRIQPQAGTKAVPLWRGKIEKVQQQAEEDDRDF